MQLERRVRKLGSSGFVNRRRTQQGLRAFAMGILELIKIIV